MLGLSNFKSKFADYITKNETTKKLEFNSLEFAKYLNEGQKFISFL